MSTLNDVRDGVPNDCKFVHHGNELQSYNAPTEPPRKVIFCTLRTTEDRLPPLIKYSSVYPTPCPKDGDLPPPHHPYAQSDVGLYALVFDRAEH